MTTKSKNKTDAWMPLWIGAYLADTQHLTRGEHGAYFLLMMAYWRNKGPLQDDDKRLSSIVKASPKEWKELRPVLVEFFKVADGTWRQKRIDAELAGANDRQDAVQRKAKEAAEARWGRHPKHPPSNAPSMLQALPEDMHEERPTPSPTPGICIQPGLNLKNTVCDPSTHTLPDSFKAEIQVSRPDLDPDIVWGVFAQKTNPKDRTIAVWRSWIARERSPVKVAVNPRSDPDTRSSIEAEGVARGLGAWQEGKEQWASYKAKVRGDKLPGLTVAQLAQVAQRRTA